MINYSKTINLPNTKFSMKASLSEKETLWLDFWNKNKVYNILKEQNKDSKKYVLHDGPPYANGNLHLGHALNKILKDIVCRFKFQNSLDVNYIPGWDCHGLPIEWKVEEKFRKTGKKKKDVDLKQFRDECRKFANTWVEIQKKQFDRFGILTDWKNIYLTMHEKSELIIISELLKFFESDQLYLGFKPVMWSVVEQTALAEAEIEYHEKKSNAIYVKFPVKNYHDNAHILIWTTTPWTIPCNRAIAFSKTLKYKLIEIKKDFEFLSLSKGEKFLLAENLISFFCDEHSIDEYEILEELKANDLQKLKCEHPLKDIGYNLEVPIFQGSHVSDEAGTGFVHIAPNHGLEDFEVGIENNLENISTINEKGVYTDNTPYFKGKHIFKAEEEVIQELRNSNSLLSCKDYIHSYPHSWRSKAPLIFRATSQWFISLDKKNLRKTVLDEIEKVEWIPKISKNRIQSMIRERPDWCVSRQRSWGVPITIFISKKTGLPLKNKEVNDRILSIIKNEGVETWFNKPTEYFLHDIENFEDYEKVDSILDVWFDSGSSHVYVLKENGFDEKADLYLEGSDQHRGWFQTSLIESCANYGVSPFKTVLTHGFVIDEKGKKMSKSLGNVILPSDVINKYGADILRIWVANSNFNEDIKISYQSLDRQAESYRKIRNTIRFILGNLNHFSENQIIEHSELPALEKFIRHKLFILNNKIYSCYEEFNFNKVFQIILNFCSQELSALFFDIRKDALYCDARDSLIVRSTKTVMSDVFQCLIRWLSPIIPFTTEEAWQCWQENFENKDSISCHLLRKNDIPEYWRSENLDKRWSKILEIKNAFSFAVEQKRNQKEIRSSLEAKAVIYLKDQQYKKIAESEDLSEILISSEVLISDSYDEEFLFNSDDRSVGVKISCEVGDKCPRCWKIFKQDKMKNDLCYRCFKVVNEN